MTAMPWFKFQPKDWRADPAVRSCSLAARGLWIELLCLMHEAEPYGHLLINGRPPTDTQLASMAGTPPEQFSSLMIELEGAGVFSKTRNGVIYSRRMTRDDKKRRDGAYASQNGQIRGSKRHKQAIEKNEEKPPPPGVDLKPPPPLEVREQKTDKLASSLEGETLPKPEEPPDRKNVHAALAAGIVQAFARANIPRIPDTSWAGVWLAKGFKPDIILPVIDSILAKNQKVMSLKYFDKAIEEAHLAAQEAQQKTTDEKPEEFYWESKLGAWKNGSWTPLWGAEPLTSGCDIPHEFVTSWLAKREKGGRMSRAGRKRKPDARRQPCGRIAQKTPKQIQEETMAVALQSRKKNYPMLNPKDPMCGYALGRLALSNDTAANISSTQHEAGLEFARRLAAYRHARGESPPFSKSNYLSGIIPHGIDCAREPTEEEIAKARKNYADCYRAMHDADKSSRVFLIVWKCCVEDRDLEFAEIGLLRMGLNALARVCGLTKF